MAFLVVGCDPVVDYNVENRTDGSVLSAAFNESCDVASRRNFTAVAWDVTKANSSLWIQRVERARCIVFVGSDLDFLAAERYEEQATYVLGVNRDLIVLVSDRDESSLLDSAAFVRIIAGGWFIFGVIIYLSVRWLKVRWRVHRKA